MSDTNYFPAPAVPKKLSPAKQHVQIKVRELNLDLNSVNTSRIQLIKNGSF